MTDALKFRTAQEPGERETTAGIERARRRALIQDTLVCLAVAALETGLLVSTLGGRIALATVLLAHCTVTIVLALLLDRRERLRTDARLLSIALVTTAIIGPVGALFSALLGLFLLAYRPNPVLLDRWYERISGHLADDPVAELHERILSGRTLDPDVDATSRFGAILRSGAIEEKQRVLSVIAQKYHPRFANLLQLALRSPDPPIRVQAAAVVARLRGEERARLKVLFAQASAEPAGSDERLALASGLIERVRSGLLDEADAVAARDIAKSLFRSVLARRANDARAAIALAELQAMDGEHEAALALLEPLVKSGSPEAVEPYRASLVQLGRYRELAAVAHTPVMAKTAA